MPTAPDTLPRTILHADMDAFYASVEQRDDPSLRGRPVAVAGAAPRGVVSAASYEARSFGVHSAMPTVQARRLCPELVVLRPRISHYAQISRQVFAILRGYSPLVEPLSLDEAFVDLSGTERLHGSAEQVARTIKQTVHRELQLVVSVGVGPNKFIAKIASDLGKPDGLLIVKADELKEFLSPLPVSRVFGVGEVTQRALSDLGISTIGELAAFPQEVLCSRFGELGKQLWELSRGIDERPVVPERPPKSIGHEDTFATDREDLEALKRIVQEQADRVAHRLRGQGYSAQTVVLKAKTPDFKLHTRRRRLPRPTCDGTTLGQAACELLTRLMPKLLSVRLTGVSVTDLSENQAPRQLTFDEPEHQQKERLARALDDIMDRFGTASVRRASSLEDASRDDPDE